MSLIQRHPSSKKTDMLKLNDVALGRVFCCEGRMLWEHREGNKMQRRLPSGCDEHMNGSNGNLCRVSAARTLTGCLAQDLPLETRTLKARETSELK